MGRRRQKVKKNGCAGERKMEGVAQLKQPTMRRHFVPALIHQYRRSMVPELARTLPIARRRSGTRTPLKILILGRKGMAKSAPLKGLVADCKDVSARKLSTTFAESSRNDTATLKAKTVKSSEKIGRWRVALASKHAQVVVEVKNKPIPSANPSTNSPVVLQKEGDAGLDHHPRLVAKKAKENPLHGWGENKGAHSLVQRSGGITGCGPCTRSRSGRIRNATETVPHAIDAGGGGLSTHCLKTDFLCIGAEGDKERKKNTTRRSLRKRGSCEADFNSSCEGLTSLLETELQETPSSGRKRRRHSQRTEDSSELKGNAETIAACQPSSKVAFEGGEGGLKVCAPQPSVPQRRQRSRRRQVAKRRGSQAAPRQKAKPAHTNVVQTDPSTAAMPAQTRLPCYLSLPNDPTRPFCQPAIAFEPADLRLGFDGLLEWPCVVANAAAESPDYVSQTEEQPRFFLCGGLPDPPRNPHWSRKATSSGDEEDPGASPHHHSPDKCAESPPVTAIAHTGYDCGGETPRELSSARIAPALGVLRTRETLDKTAEERLQRDFQRVSSSSERLQRDVQRLSSRLLTADTTMQPTDASQEGMEPADEENDWIFTPPGPERARAIVDYMGDTITRIIATTQAVQRRTETYSKICERLICIDKLRHLSWQEKATEDAGDWKPPRCSGTETRQWSSASSKSHEAWGQAIVRAGGRDQFDENSRSQSNSGAREKLHCAKPTIQQQPSPAQAAAVSASVGLHTPGYLADLESRLLRNPAFENDESARSCLQLVKKYRKNAF